MNHKKIKLSAIAVVTIISIMSGIRIAAMDPDPTQPPPKKIAPKLVQTKLQFTSGGLIVVTPKSIPSQSMPLIPTIASDPGSQQPTDVVVKQVFAKSYISPSKLLDAAFVINPYTGCPHKCMYCYAEYMKNCTGHDIEDWGDFVDVKTCSTPIDVSKIKSSQEVLISSVTDAYNPYEATYGVTRSILQQFVDTPVKLVIITKSGLVARDIDLLRRIPNVSVHISMNTIDDRFRQQIEPRSYSVAGRIEALKALKAAGIKTCVFMALIFPGITDFKAIIEATRPFVDLYSFENLNLSGSYMHRVLGFISQKYPTLNGLYNQIYKYGNKVYWETLQKEISSYCETNKVPYKLYFYRT